MPLLCLVFELLNVLGLQSRFGSTQSLAGPLDEKPIESMEYMFVVFLYLFETAQIFEHKICAICVKEERDLQTERSRLYFGEQGSALFW